MLLKHLESAVAVVRHSSCPPISSMSIAVAFAASWLSSMTGARRFEAFVVGACLDGRDRLRRRQWHLDHELAASPVSFTAGVEASRMKLHQPACEREANAQSGLRSPFFLREQIEHTRQELPRNPDS